MLATFSAEVFSHVASVVMLMGCCSASCRFVFSKAVFMPPRATLGVVCLFVWLMTGSVQIICGRGLMETFLQFLL